MSDVLRLSCSIENEIGRNAIKNFASLLEKVFNEYHNIVDAHLQLLNQSESKNVEISFPFVKSQLQDFKDNNISSPEKLHKAGNEAANQVLLNAAEVSTFVAERDTRTPECNSEFDDTFLNRSESSVIDIQPDKLLKSPVLGKKSTKLKKNIISSRIILDSTSESNPPSSEKRNALCSKNNSPKDSTKVTINMENKDLLFAENCDNNDEIACTPVAKVPKRLGVSKLYNVDTILLSNGKKLKQSRLMFFPAQQDTSATCPEKVISPQKAHESPVPKNNIKRYFGDTDEDKQIDEEIIESSPKCSKLFSRTKSYMKLKGNNSKRSIDQISDRESNRPSTEYSDGEFSNTKLHTPVIKMEEFSPNQESPLMYTPTQEIKPYPTHVCTLVSDRHKSDCDILATSQSPVFDIEHFSSAESNKNHGIAKTNIHAQKRKCVEPIDAFSTCNDDTFFTLEKENKGQNINNTENSEFESTMFDDGILQKSPPSKRSLMCSFDRVPEQKGFNPKSRVERAKMAGISCWECKQYYVKLGLTEDKMKARQNQCSRHRTRYKQRESSPEGFWNPLFPDTISSTFQDD